MTAKTLPIPARTDVGPIDEPTVQDVLGYARKLVSKGWAKRFSAIDSKGIQVGFREDADKFCTIGAISRAVIDLSHNPLLENKLWCQTTNHFVLANNIEKDFSEKWYRRNQLHRRFIVFDKFGCLPKFGWLGGPNNQDYFGGLIPLWNDKWYRTKRSVLRSFDNAIAQCE